MSQVIKDSRIDDGKAFDWGRTSKNYAKYRDIYPQEFYNKIVERNLCVKGQEVLDLGTGTGVLPRNMISYGAHFTGTDISDNQIAMARKMAKEAGMDITFLTSSAENLDFKEKQFDVITACQCFWYFDPMTVAPKLYSLLKENGRLVVLYMAWLPFEDPIAGASEELVLKYSPKWSGAGETKHPIAIADEFLRYFEPIYHDEYDIAVPFTKDSWNGRMKACRGVEASLTKEEVASWEKEHVAMLDRLAPEQFTIKHYGAIVELKKRESVID